MITLTPNPTDETPHGGDPITLLAISDGMGGHVHGEDVSSQGLLKFSLALVEDLILAPSINQRDPLPPISPTLIAHALQTAMEQSSAHIRRMIKINNWGKAGATLVAAAIWRNLAIVINLGDSPLFHFRNQNQDLTKVTVDHSVAGLLVHVGMITPEMGRYHAQRSQLEFFLGSEKFPNPSPLAEVTLATSDLLLLCSDGISGSLLPDQIQAILAEPLSLEEKADRLIEISLVEGETDNQTLILWQYNPSVDPRVLNTVPAANLGHHKHRGQDADPKPTDSPETTGITDVEIKDPDMFNTFQN